MDAIAQHAARHPARAAVVDGDRTLTWRDYHDTRNRLARALAALGLRAAITPSFTPRTPRSTCSRARPRARWARWPSR